MSDVDPLTKLENDVDVLFTGCTESKWHVGYMYKTGEACCNTERCPCNTRRIKYRYFGCLDGRNSMALVAQRCGYTILWC